MFVNFHPAIHTNFRIYNISRKHKVSKHSHLKTVDCIFVQILQNSLTQKKIKRYVKIFTYFAVTYEY